MNNISFRIELIKKEHVKKNPLLSSALGDLDSWYIMLRKWKHGCWNWNRMSKRWKGKRKSASDRNRGCGIFTIRLTSILGFNCFLRFSRLLLKGFRLNCNWLMGIKIAAIKSSNYCLPISVFSLELVVSVSVWKTVYFSPHLWSNFLAQ